ncbi:MAG: polysaccharide deacetylase family protein [Endomicrobiia bacterium]|nr:polysaccharide deacetylase family protein [Endomicrobiia bacterium]
MNKVIVRALLPAAFFLNINYPLAADTPRPSGSFLSEVKTTRRAFALSFDDGPGDYTISILEELKRRGARATFFVMGSQIKGREATLKKILADGHEIGNHTYSHVNFYVYKKDDRAARLKDEIEKTDRIIYGIVGKRPRMLRMPHGYCAKWSRDVARETGHIMVNWSRGYDWMGLSAEETSRKYVEAVAPGAILLFHDGGPDRKKTLNALEAVLDKAAKSGYEVFSVGELISLSR